MLEEFRKHIESTFENLQNQAFLLACSGGLDSVVMAHLCVACKLDFSIAHCNFQLRGEDSIKDELFVRDLAKQLYKTIYVTHFDTKSYVEEYKTSVQIAARDLRYSWFSEIVTKHNLGAIVTAHHSDDNLETFLINLSRGTGIDGLVGIPEKTKTLARPLLKFSRKEILAYAKSHKLAWREDGSNADTKYLRNKIRHEIVPLLKELHPSFSDNFQHTQSYLKETAILNKVHLKAIKEMLFKEEENYIKIEIAALEKLQPQKPYLYGLFKDYGFTELGNVVSLLTAITGKEVLSRTHRLVKHREHILLQKIEEETSEVFYIEKKEVSINEPIILNIQEVSEIQETSKEILYVDKKTLKYPLEVRKWRKGDYFYPMGVNGKKTISKFFKDEKLDLISKEKQWVLCSDTAIVWVIGKRVDDRFKITKKTENILKFTLTK
ncbi:MAG: tRNA lysidine(34) synthetase TilS [Cellulophaga sp.]